MSFSLLCWPRVQNREMGLKAPGKAAAVTLARFSSHAPTLAPTLLQSALPPSPRGSPLVGTLTSLLHLEKAPLWAGPLSQPSLHHPKPAAPSNIEPCATPLLLPGHSSDPFPVNPKLAHGKQISTFSQFPSFHVFIMVSTSRLSCPASNYSSERSGDFPKTTQLIRGRAGT